MAVVVVGRRYRAAPDLPGGGWVCQVRTRSRSSSPDSDVVMYGADGVRMIGSGRLWGWCKLGDWARLVEAGFIRRGLVM